jgi:hypothetical protein
MAVGSGIDVGAGVLVAGEAQAAKTRASTTNRNANLVFISFTPKLLFNVCPDFVQNMYIFYRFCTGCQ